MAREMVLEEGFQIAEAAKVLKVSRTTAWRWVTDNGQKLIGRRHLRRIDRKLIRTLRDKHGFTFPMIAEVVGCTPVTARKYYHGQPAGGSCR